MKILIALALLSTFASPAFAQTDRVAKLETAERELLCRGPVAVIPDDDPGLALYADVIASEGLEEAKVELAFNRGETCDDSEQLSVMTMAKRLSIAEHLLCPNGVNDWTEEGPSCD